MPTIGREVTKRVLTAYGVSPICVGQVVGWNDADGILVDFPGNTRGPQIAKIARSLASERMLQTFRGRQSVLLVFDKGDHDCPIVVDTVIASNKMGRVSGTGENDVIQNNIYQTDELGSDMRSSGVKSGARSTCLAKILIAHEEELYIDFEGNAEGPLKAKTTILLRNTKDPVVVMFLSNDEPVIIGQLCNGNPSYHSGDESSEIIIKGEKVRIEASQGITLVANQSQVHIDGRGKITTVADTIVSRARGANKVQGGSVQLN
jgi:hypothetical protein